MDIGELIKLAEQEVATQIKRVKDVSKKAEELIEESDRSSEEEAEDEERKAEEERLAALKAEEERKAEEEGKADGSGSSNNDKNGDEAEKVKKIKADFNKDVDLKEFLDIFGVKTMEELLDNTSIKPGVRESNNIGDKIEKCEKVDNFITSVMINKAGHIQNLKDNIPGDIKVFQQKKLMLKNLKLALQVSFEKKIKKF